MTVGQMLDCMGASEFMDWLHYHHAEPWGERREDLRFGVLCSVVANLMGNDTKPSDFFRLDDPAPQASSLNAEILSAFQAIKHKQRQENVTHGKH